MIIGLTLSYLVPGADFVIENNDYATLVWHGPGAAPTLAQVEAAWPAAQAAALVPVQNEATLRQQAEAALDTNRAFLADQNITTADAIAQVKELTRQNIGLIRLALRKLDGVS